MKRLILAFTLAASIVTVAPVVLPEQATQAAAAFIARTTDGVLVYVWYWVSMPGQPNGGQWVLIGIEPYMGW